ncbi:MAG: hypothetical protein IPH58_05560 [Sphingobacteriales bacterium]|jgi:hypothetical protein|nr:hypothetical protein [Sphingobacteriales bacterium]
MSINTTEFAWSDITVTAMGRTFERILAIEYDVEQEKKQIYGRGKKVKGIQRQNEKPVGKLTIGQSELEAMIAAAGGKVTELVMDIQVHYLDSDKGAIVKDRIVGAEFTKAPKSMKQGDSDMEVELEFIAMDILYNQ